MSGEETKALEAGLQALALDMRRVEAPEHVEQRLLAAFRAHAAHRPAPARRARRSWWIPVAACVAAAAAGVVFGVFLTRDHQPAETRQPGRSAVQLAVADWPADTEVAAEDSGFVALPNAESLSPNEEVDLVRVEVPRSAILALGLPLGEERISERVKADIALGADGTARAVRIWKD